MTYRYVVDQVGSVRAIVNTATGAAAQELDYDSFGRVLRDTAPGLQPFGFAGGQWDSVTGLVRFGARDYAAEVGQWVAGDTYRFDGGQLNLRQYSGAQPVDLHDPSGHLVPIIIVAAIGGAITGGVASAVSQYMQTGTINPGQVLAEALLWGVVGALIPIMAVMGAEMLAVGGAATATSAGLGALSGVGQGVTIQTAAVWWGISGAAGAYAGFVPNCPAPGPAEHLPPEVEHAHVPY